MQDKRYIIYKTKDLNSKSSLKDRDQQFSLKIWIEKSSLKA